MHSILNIKIKDKLGRKPSRIPAQIRNLPLLISYVSQISDVKMK